MGGKSRKTGRVSPVLIDRLAKMKKENMSPEERLSQVKPKRFRKGFFTLEQLQKFAKQD